MWSDLKDNHNKFYIIQALQDKNGASCFLWTRFGRVGVNGVSNREYAGNPDGVAKKFYSLERQKCRKGYTEIKMSLGSSSKPVEPIVTVAKQEDFLPSKLDSNVQDFVKLIFNQKLMEESVIKIGYDVKKMPLGELQKETVLKGY